MYKNQLQELCQNSSYPLPTYETTCEGPQHSPRFSTTVTVNSLTFTSFPPSSTVELSENDAAMIAYHHFDSLQHPAGTPFLRDLHLFPQPRLSDSSDSSLSQGSPVHNPEVESTLRIDTVMQPYSEPASETFQISIPVATVADVTKAQDMKMEKTPSSSKSKAIPSFSDSNNVEFETNNVSSTAVSTSSLRKKVIVYATEGDVEMENSDDKWIASSYSH